MKYPRIFENVVLNSHRVNPQDSEVLDILLHDPLLSIWDFDHIDFRPLGLLWEKNRRDLDFQEAFNRQLIAPPASFWFEMKIPQELACVGFNRGEGIIEFFALSDNPLISTQVYELVLISSPRGICIGSETNDPTFLTLGNLITQAIFFINEPTLKTTQTHHRHKGLERKAKKFKLGELKGFTKITQSEPLSGTPRSLHQKSQHWCRSHLRFVNGNFTNVTGHWRGNPELGRTIGIRQ